MPPAFVPETLVAGLVIRPRPRAIDDFLHAHDVSRGECGCGRGEGIGNVPTEAVIAVGPGEMACQLVERESIISELFPQVCDLTSTADYFCMESTMADDLGT